MVDRDDPVTGDALDEQLRILDGFAHPEPDEELLGALTASVTAAARRRRRESIVLKVGGPLAAAAAIIVAVGLLWQMSQTTGRVERTGTYTMSANGNGDPLAETLDRLEEEVQRFARPSSALDRGGVVYDEVGQEIEALSWELSL